MMKQFLVIALALWSANALAENIAGIYEGQLGEQDIKVEISADGNVHVLSDILGQECNSQIGELQSSKTVYKTDARFGKPPWNRHAYLQWNFDFDPGSCDGGDNIRFEIRKDGYSHLELRVSQGFDEYKACSSPIKEHRRHCQIKTIETYETVSLRK